MKKNIESNEIDSKRKAKESPTKTDSTNIVDHLSQKTKKKRRVEVLNEKNVSKAEEEPPKKSSQSDLINLVKQKKKKLRKVLEEIKSRKKNTSSKKMTTGVSFESTQDQENLQIEQNVDNTPNIFSTPEGTPNKTTDIKIQKTPDSSPKNKEIYLKLQNQETRLQKIGNELRKRELLKIFELDSEKSLEEKKS